MTITQQDLNDVKEDIKAYIAERVGRVESRLDTLNGSIARHERELARHAAQLEFPQASQKNNATIADDDKPAITRRDVKILGSLFTATTIIINLVLMYLNNHH